MDKIIFGDKFSLISNVSFHYRQWKNLIDRGDSGKTLALLLGAGVSLATSECPGIPGPNEVVEIIRNQFDDPDELEHFNNYLEKTGRGNYYQAAMTKLGELRGQDEINRIIKNIVLVAMNKNGTEHPNYKKIEKGDPGVLRDFEKNAHLWHINPALEAIGRLVKHGPRFFGQNILTTNFDPLIEIGIRNAKAPVNQIFLNDDGRIDGFESDDGARVIHLHGYWHGNDTLHTPLQLTKPRIRLKASLQSTLKKTILLVVGYAGWDDIVMHALKDILDQAEGSIEVLWAFYEDSSDVIIQKYEHIFTKLKDGIEAERIHFYCGINAHEIFPELADKVNTTNQAISKRKRDQKKEEVELIADNETFGMKNIFISLEPNVSIEAIIKRSRPKLELTKIFNFEEKNKGIGFDLYEGKDVVFSETQVIKFLSLHRGSNILQTGNYIRANFESLGRNQQLIVLLPKEYSHSHLEIRKNAVKAQFVNPKTKVYYIDEFIWELCMPDNFKIDHLKIFLPNFIEPYLLNGQTEKALQYIDKWHNTDDKPVLLIKGGGGMGKTTLARKYLEKVISSEVIGFFIDVNDILGKIDILIRNKPHLELYDLYLAHLSNDLGELPSTVAIDRDLFKLSLDYGKICIVIDGLEEIITRFGDHFDVNNFLNSLKLYSDDNKHAKILITCRDYFLDNKQIQFDYTQIELLPFNRELSRLFFESHFPDQKNKKAVVGLKIAENLVGKQGMEKISPFILDIVKYIISQSNFRAVKADKDFFTHVLFNKLEDDYIIGKICNREQTKLADRGLSIDEQIKVFLEIAQLPNSVVNGEELEHLISAMIYRNLNDDNINFFKSHPLLKVLQPHDPELFTFRYDFLEKYFWGVKLSEVLKGNDAWNENLMKILGNGIYFNSQFTANILRRTFLQSDELSISLIEALKYLADWHPNENNQDFFMRKAKSAIFTFGLNTLKLEGLDNIISNTQCIKDFFEVGGVIRDFHIYNLTVNDYGKKKVLFDFSGLKFENCTFFNYDAFWDCTFSKDTIFEKCRFEQIGVNPNKGKVDLRNFVSCDFVFDSIIYDNETKENNKEHLFAEAKSHLIIFLRIFYLKGGFKGKSETEIKKSFNSYRNLKLKGNEMINVLGGLIIEEAKGGQGLSEFYQVKSKHKEDARNFFSQGTPSEIISKCINKIYEAFIFSLETDAPK